MQEFILAFLGSLCAGFIFNVRGYKLIFTGLSGVAGWMVYIGLVSYTDQSVISIFAGAIAVGLYSESAARLLKTPSTVFSIPGIFPIVPGIAAYEAIQYMTSNDLYSAGGKLVETLTGACAIAFGILLVTALFRIISKPKKQARPYK
ncbi:MAG: threonine/serine exporter family protein [Clostridiaceae bacterium]